MAAISLGVSVSEVKKRIRESDALLARWGSDIRHSQERPQAPSETEGICSTPIVSKPDTTDSAIESFAQLDRRLAKGLEGLGLSERQREKAVKMAAFHRDFFASCLHLTGGNIAIHGIDLRTESEEIRQRLAEVRGMLREPTPDGTENPAAYRAMLVDEEDRLMRRYVDIGFLLERFANCSSQMALTQATIHQRVNGGRQGGTNGSAKVGRPGFSAAQTSSVQTD